MGERSGKAGHFPRGFPARRRAWRRRIVSEIVKTDGGLYWVGPKSGPWLCRVAIVISVCMAGLRSEQ